MMLKCKAGVVKASYDLVRAILMKGYKQQYSILHTVLLASAICWHRSLPLMFTVIGIDNE
jgi:hypothetical protein